VPSRSHGYNASVAEIDFRRLQFRKRETLHSQRGALSLLTVNEAVAFVRAYAHREGKLVHETK
jgi:hypothetical protein